MKVYFGGGKEKPWTGTVNHCWPGATVLTGGKECWPDPDEFHQCEFPDSLTVEPIGILSLEGTECMEQRSCPHLFLAREPSLGLSVCGFAVDCCCKCRPQQSPTIPGVEVCPAECGGVGGFCRVGLNPNNGNVSVGVGMPDAGAMAPADVLTYNSRWGGPSPYGYGVFGMHGMHVEAFGGGCDARLYRCDGSVYCFSSKAADGTYRYVPPGA
ncbi:MAG: hypothetical protein MUE50_21755, partial [Pirellulaceae bacterium]|nr:hypothetical protein [Bryobacter sp.]MCU0874965.1 hypothetical protein [Pirellulaceae bacterium]